jgi:hypothetical protein
VSCITIRIPVTGIEPAAILLKVKCSASELHRCIPYTNLNFPFIKAPCFLEVGLPTYLSIRLLLYIDFANNIYYAVMSSSIQDGLVLAIKNILFTELIFMFMFMFLLVYYLLRGRLSRISKDIRQHHLITTYFLLEICTVLL